MVINMYNYRYMNIETPVLVVDCSNNEANVLFMRIKRLVSDMDKINIHNIVLENVEPSMIEQVKLVALENPLLYFQLRLDYCEYINLYYTSRQNNIKNLIIVPKTHDIECENEICLIECDVNNYEHVISKIASRNVHKFMVTTIRPSLNLMRLSNHNGLTWDELDNLYCCMIDNQRILSSRMMIEYGFLSTRLLTEHPCNGYVCDGKHCHSGKRNLPRRIYVNHRGYLCPEHPNLPEQYFMGSVDKDTLLNILEQYNNSEAHSLFLQIAHSVYVNWVLPCPFRVIPWAELMLISASEYHANIIV